MKQPKTVIVVRKDLELPAGKWIAQAVHAVMRGVAQKSELVSSINESYESAEAPICIVCYVKSEVKLLKLYEQAKLMRLPCGLQRDAGHNFVVANTPTVLSIGPAPVEQIDQLTKNLQLYKG